MRVSLGVLLLLIIMIITFVIVFVANVVKPKNLNNCPSYKVTYDVALASEGNSETSYLKDCFCL